MAEGGGYYPKPDDEGFVDEESEEDMEMDGNEPESPQYYADQISVVQYEKQRKEYTKYAVHQLTSSPEYQRRWNTCSTCWCCWSEGMFSNDCMECGGFPLTRSCPICQGRCNCTWHRDVEMSHDLHEAHWDGKCGLPWEEQQGFMFQTLVESDEDAVVDSFGDLTAS